MDPDPLAWMDIYSSTDKKVIVKKNIEFANETN